ncbi:MAG: tetratricopeptide repeat protein, partial [Planctomycetota bacterium]
MPSVYSIAPKSPSAGVAPPSERSLERLPTVGRVALAELRPYAIDLTERHDPPALTPPSNSPAPTNVKIVTEKEAAPERLVPQKRIVEAKAPKPPIPPLTKQSAAAPSGSAGWLMTGTSLVAVSQRADGMIDHGYVLAEKGAYYSAQTEFKQALRTVAQALDAHYGGSHHSQALAAGWLALDEAGDFSAQSQRGPVVDVGLIVESHQTRLLKDYALNGVSPVLAMQHYFAFAQEQLVEACGRAPVASRALHGLGKIHMVLGEKSGSAERLHGPKAIAFQQAALTTDPGNFLAANEMGVLLARFGKLQEARTVLQYAVSRSPLPETWQNLSVVHQRLGEADLAAQAFAHWQVASQQS